MVGDNIKIKLKSEECYSLRRKLINNSPAKILVDHPTDNFTIF